MNSSHSEQDDYRKEFSYMIVTLILPLCSLSHHWQTAGFLNKGVSLSQFSASLDCSSEVTLTLPLFFRSSLQILLLYKCKMFRLCYTAYTGAGDYVYFINPWRNFVSQKGTKLAVYSVLKTYLYCVSLQAKGLWMSSSKEILLFRRILFNPVTCTQFQHFVSLRGDFLENDVLFWLEVQRYKVRISRGHCACGSHGVTAMTPLLYAILLSAFSTITW